MGGLRVGQNWRCGSPEVGEHTAHFWKSMERGRWGENEAGGALMARVRHSTLPMKRFRQR